MWVGAMFPCSSRYNRPMQELSLIQQLSVMLLPLIFAVTVHEAAHGWVASKLGDPTAHELGRITFNPVPHIDLVGTILLPLGLYTLSTLVGGVGFLFGYARPVPVNAARLRHPRRDMALVAAAGPGANLVMALLWAGVVVLAPYIGSLLPGPGVFLMQAGAFGVLINLFLMVLNLLPIPPLDGGRVVTSSLPLSLARHYARLEPWGMVILLGLLLSGWLESALVPMVFSLYKLLLGVALL